MVLRYFHARQTFFFRGVKMNGTNKYKKEQIFMRVGFHFIDIFVDEKFVGQKGQMAFPSINCHNEKDIREYSFFKSESEQEYRVLGILPTRDMTIVELEEKNKKSVFELFNKGNSKPKDEPLSPPPKPVIKQPGKMKY